MIALLDPRDCTAFPSPHEALREPNGLLAVGGDLTPARLENAYRRGIFPWYSPGDPILWWSPDPRTVLFPDALRISRSLRKRLRRQEFVVTLDQDFNGVLLGCAQPRDYEGGTWLVPEMIDAYQQLHRLGLAHSVEVWREKVLVGGLYGVAIGRVFFGESMFSRVADASKVALVHLCERLAHWDYGLIDCQMRTEHLIRLGAIELPRDDFIALLNRYRDQQGRLGSWFDAVDAPTLDGPTRALAPSDGVLP